jgi:hypothetical protein
MVGDRVRVSDLSGVDSRKEGVVVRQELVKTDGRGVPTNVEGAYRPVDWRNETAVRLDDGSLITMFNNRLTNLGKAKPQLFQEPPPPAEVDKLAWAKFLPNLRASLQIIQDAGGMVLGYNPDDAFYNYVKIRLGREELSFGAGNDLGNPAAMRSMLKIYPKLEEFAAKHQGAKDVFYSDISRWINSLGEIQGKDLAYRVACKLLRNRGIEVHSSSAEGLYKLALEALQMPLQDLVKEHEELVEVLKKDDPKEIQDMAKEQGEELKGYRRKLDGKPEKMA